MSLSLKALQPDPLMDLQHQTGESVVGTVTKIAPIGAFIRIEDRPHGFEGLLRNPYPTDGLVAVGDILTVRIVDVDVARRRIELALAVAGND